MLKKQHREALLLDNFVNVDGITAGRSLRDRKPVTYTFGKSYTWTDTMSFIHNKFSCRIQLFNKNFLLNLIDAKDVFIKCSISFLADIMIRSSCNVFMFAMKLSVRVHHCQRN